MAEITPKLAPALRRFVLPTMEEIHAEEGKNGLTAISTFSGCGGSSLGYKMAGFRVPVACEFVPGAAQTYRDNAPGTTVLEDNIRELSGQQILDVAGLEPGALDLLDGSPPCSAYSTAGIRDRGWGKEKQYSGSIEQRTDDLFPEYIRLVHEMRPKTFVAENVAGLTIGKAEGYFKEAFMGLQEAGDGYNVQVKLLQAAKMGIPQTRNRLIFIGVRKDLGLDPVWPKPQRYVVPLGKAIEGLPEPPREDYEILREGTRTRAAWENTDIVRDGGCFRYAYRRLYGFDARWAWFRLNPSLPCPTITAKVATLIRWDEPRSLSVAEGMRVQTFPDDFKLTGSFRQRWERVGRAVPPLMMGQIASAIAHGVFGYEGETLADRIIRETRES